MCAVDAKVRAANICITHKVVTWWAHVAKRRAVWERKHANFRFRCHVLCVMCAW
jgi:hypothetical protein